MNLVTRLRSIAIRYFSSARFLQSQRNKARRAREKRGEAPQVHYFHQVDDPYSHLAVQKLDELQQRYCIPFTPHLIPAAQAKYRGSSQHFDAWARQDAESIAGNYGTTFSPTIKTPDPAAVSAANNTLAEHLPKASFAEVAIDIGKALWSGQSEFGDAATRGGEQAVAAGSQLQRSLGHYQGGMFYFDGEWFWGIDRLRSLEERLNSEGFANQPGKICVPEPAVPDTSTLDTDGILLEYFPSLRSPYTAVGHARVLALLKRSGVDLRVRPVMPMLMRGIPAPREKQRYIITDAAREGRASGAPLGRVVDPFGEPVKRAFALFAGAAKLGYEIEFVTAYLNAAWFEGVDIARERGLQQVAAEAGINWDTLLAATAGADWEALLQANLEQMFTHNLWGVPSFRVTGGNSDQAYACWGQDRIWRVEYEIAQRAKPVA